MTLELRDICLSYSKKTVLQNLSLTFEGGQLHALLGENGAGKSTAANIICGELQPDKGQILLDGEEVCFPSPRAAIEHGVCYVHQTPMLADSISIKENLLLGIKKEYLKNIGAVTQEWIPDLMQNTPVKNLNGGQRFFIALCSALIKCPRILLLDEPTALLDEQQKKFLFEKLKELAAGGMNIIIITHNYDEAETWCDTIDFLENGQITQKKRLASLVAELDSACSPQEQGSTIEFTDLCSKSANDIPLYNISFSIQKGKITLIQGLAEDGLNTLEKILISMSLSGLTRQSLQRKDCAIIPTDRKYTGSNPNLTVLQMLTAALDVPENQKQQLAQTMIKAAGINITPQEKCKNLSGGMLQKLLFERELYNKPKLLILCNPLQGLDHETCLKTCKRIKQAALDGAYVLVLSYGAFPAQFSDICYKLRNGKL